MVEFCSKCNMSLPTADLTIKDGELYISPDFICPECGKLASPKSEEKVDIEPTDQQDVVIRKGFIVKEQPYAPQ